MKCVYSSPKIGSACWKHSSATMGGEKQYIGDFKQLVISPLLTSAMAYKYLAKMSKFPQKSAAFKWLKKFRCEEGLQDDVFMLMEENVDKMSPEDRFDSLLADEVWLMSYDVRNDIVHGIQTGPHGSLAPLNCISSLGPWNASKLETGFVPLLLLDSNLGASKESFSYILLLHMTGWRCRKHRSWPISSNSMAKTHQTVFRAGREARLRMAPKPTDQHVNPSPVCDKMHNCAASQVQSHSVAEGLQTYTSKGLLSNEVFPFSNYHHMTKDIFALVNSSTKEDPLPFKTAVIPALLLGLDSDSHPAAQVTGDEGRKSKTININLAAVTSPVRPPHWHGLKLEEIKEKQVKQGEVAFSQHG